MILKGILKVAILLEKKDVLLFLEKLISLGLMEPKDAEIELRGPYRPGNLVRYLAAKDRVEKLVLSCKENGLKPKKKLIVEDPFSFLDKFLFDNLDILEKKNSFSDNDILQIFSAYELLSFFNLVFNFTTRTRKTNHFVLVEGWVEKEKLPEIKKLVEGKLFLFEYVEDKNAPVRLAKQGILSVFLPLVRMYPPFKYGSLDITPILAISFPLIFGMMFADVVDGFLLLLATFLIHIKTRNRDFLILIPLSLFSILFGFLFKDVFEIYSSPILLLIVVLSVGYIHLLIGYLINLINSYLLKEDRFSSWGDLVLFLSLPLFLVSKEIFILLAAIGILLKLKGEGVKSIAALPHVFGHWFSYARIFAISISHHSIASAFILLSNRFFAGNGILDFAAGALILIIGHLILLTIELLVAFIHTLRLHVLEFGTKFMRVGKGWFSPYNFKFKYTDVKVWKRN